MQGRFEHRSGPRRDVRLWALLVTTSAILAGGYGFAVGSSAFAPLGLGWAAAAVLILSVVAILKWRAVQNARRNDVKAPDRPARGTVRVGAARLSGLAIVAAGILLSATVVAVMSPVAPAWWSGLLLTITSLTSPLSHADLQRRREIDLRFKQGVAMLQAKQYEYALTAFHRVLQLNPEMPEAYVNSGFAMFELKRFKEAADFFNDALELRSNQLNAYYGLALALKELGQLEGAVGAMRTYTHLAKPDDPFQRKAWAALWEWETELKIQRGQQPPIPPELIMPRNPPPGGTGQGQGVQGHAEPTSGR